MKSEDIWDVHNWKILNLEIDKDNRRIINRKRTEQSELCRHEGPPAVIIIAGAAKACEVDNYAVDPAMRCNHTN